MKLYSAWYCPFAQRAWMALLHKGIYFDYIEVDPYRESKWWLKISRATALVPVIVNQNADNTGETTIVESNRTLEFIDHLRPDYNPLFSSDPNQCAEQKYWMDHINNKIVPYLYRFLKAAEADSARDESRNQLISGVRQLTRAMQPDGLFFSGQHPGAVDFSLIPFSYRIDTLLGHYRDFHLPETGEIWQRYQNWYQALLQLPCFRATSVDHDNYRQRLIEHYQPYSLGEGQQDVSEV
jgi:glutathione S-transferase